MGPGSLRVVIVKNGAVRFYLRAPLKDELFFLRLVLMHDVGYKYSKTARYLVDSLEAAGDFSCLDLAYGGKGYAGLLAELYKGNVLIKPFLSEALTDIRR